MIVQILRTVLFGAAVYFLSKLARGLIDKQLNPPEKEDKSFDHSNVKNSDPARLTPCPECGTYYNAEFPHQCETES